MGTNVARKRRTMSDAIVEDTSQVPAFPTGPDANGVMKFAGDFQGARVMGMEWIVSGTFDLTTLDGVLQHSDDGVTWHTVDGSGLAFSQLSGNGSEFIDIDPDSYQLKRYLRFSLTAGSSGTTTNVELAIYYNQVGAPGNLAFAGTVDRRS